MVAKKHFWTKFEHYSEKELITYFEENLSKSYHIIHSFYMKNKPIHYEIDFIIICPNNSIILIEQKCWGDEITGNNNEWRFRYRGKRYTTKRKSPYDLLQKKQRKLKESIDKLDEVEFSGVLIHGIIVIGSISRTIQFNLEGEVDAISYNPESALDFLKELNSKRKRKKKIERSFRQFEILKENYENIDRSQLSKITISQNNSRYMYSQKQSISDMILLVCILRTYRLQINFSRLLI